MSTTDCSRFTTNEPKNNPFMSDSRYAKPMSTTDCSNNRFVTFFESQKNNLFANKRESNESPPASTRWSTLSSEEERTPDSPRNTFQKSRRNFGPDKNDNYRKSTFRKETRPKTPPLPTFDFKEDQFPSLG